MRELLDQIERLIVAMHAEHEQLLALVRRKQEAMRMARPALVTDCCERENERIQRIAELEKRRQELVGAITQIAAPGAGEPLALSRVAQLADEPQRGRMLVMHARLRELIERIHGENAVARAATEGLLHHVRGVMQSVTRMVADAGTYGRRGQTPSPHVAVSSFTITG